MLKLLLKTLLYSKNIRIKKTNSVSKIWSYIVNCSCFLWMIDNLPDKIKNSEISPFESDLSTINYRTVRLVIPRESEMLNLLGNNIFWDEFFVRKFWKWESYRFRQTGPLLIIFCEKFLLLMKIDKFGYTRKKNFIMFFSEILHNYLGFLKFWINKWTTRSEWEF